jgi:carboxymethylenebutenolidase
MKISFRGSFFKGTSASFEVSVESENGENQGMWIEVTRGDGSSMRAYAALPSSVEATTPSVVMMMHVWGVDESMREVAHGFADQGYAIVVPDLYARFDGVPDVEEKTDYTLFKPFAEKLTTETIDADTAPCVAWLRERYAETKTAIAGFCMGGTMASYRTVGYTNLYSAAALWYGLSNDVDPAKAEIPIVASYGADDTGYPKERIEAFRDKLTVPNDFKIYPNAGHGFFDQTRKNYEPNAADDSLKRTISFLNEHLKAQ